jgi:hypothetical protein
MPKETKILQLKEEQFRLTEDGRVLIDDAELYDALRQTQTDPVNEEGMCFKFQITEVQVQAVNRF